MSEDAVLRFATTTGEAASAALAAVVPNQEIGAITVSVVPGPDEALAGLSTPAVVSSISYLGGVTGGNTFGLGSRAALKIAAAMMGSDPDTAGDGELGELEVSAVAEAANQMMAAAAAATGQLLDEAIEITAPDTRIVSRIEGAVESLSAAYTTMTTFSVCGETCRLVQLIPNAFVVRLSNALDGIAAADPVALAAPGVPGSVTHALKGLTVRLTASLGRAELPVRDVLAVGAGAVVELDRGVDEPIDLFLNGAPFATARLVVADDGEWAVRIDEILIPESQPLFEASISQGGD